MPCYMDGNNENNIKIIQPHPGFQERFVRSNVDVVFGGGVLASGKEQPLDSKILTSNGWSTMGDMYIGATILTPWNGETKVTGIFPQGEKDIFELRTSDGRVCEAGREHLWEVRTRKQVEKYRRHKENKNFMVLTTNELIDGMSKGKKYYLPIPKAQEFSGKNYVIHPYVLGVMIGDGCLTYKSNPHKTCFTISNPEQDIIDKVAKLTDTVRIYSHPSTYCKVFFSHNAREYLNYLERVGLRDYSYNKYIPSEYLFGSIEQRKQLLCGLMDTDGTIGKKNTYSFSTTSSRLAQDFVELCRSLGYIATISEDKRSYKYTSGKAYSIGIHTDDIIFSSKKHWERFKRFYKQSEYYKTKDHVRITSIEYVGKKQAQCIMVNDKDHLYITDDFITTHNSFAAILSLAEPSLDPNFRACFTRRTFGELKTGGGIVDDIESCYKGYAEVKKTDPPRATFPCGSFVEMRQINDEDEKKVTEKWKGAQFDLIYMDELTSYEFSTFKYLLTRNRGKGKWTGKFRGTTNPERDCWVRKFIDWYIGSDGLIMPERDGVVRYFYINGNTIDDVVWGDTKEEVYERCRLDIDRQLKGIGGKFTYENLIKSFTFYLGHMSENTSLLEGNKDYAGSVAAVGGKKAQQLIEGNWNVSTREDGENPIPYNVAESVFMNDPRENNDMWITADLADTGTDNTIILVWNGLHIIDMAILCTSTPRMNADKLELMAEKHGIPNSHIIFDGIRAAYINDYIEEAIPYMSYKRAIGKYGRAYYNLKDECYARMISVIKRRNISFDTKIASSIYAHNKLNKTISVQVEFIDECSVVRFKDLPGGKRTLLNKKEMNHMLGKGRSMDLLDPIAMRMYPLLGYEYGQELIMTAVEKEVNNDKYFNVGVNVYNQSLWC